MRRRLAHDLVRLPQLAVTALQGFGPGRHLSRRASLAAGGALRVLHPLVQRLVCAADRGRDRQDRGSARRTLRLMLQHHPHRTFANLRRRLFAVLLVIVQASQEFEPPTNPERFRLRVVKIRRRAALSRYPLTPYPLGLRVGLRIASARSSQARPSFPVGAVGMRMPRRQRMNGTSFAAHRGCKSSPQSCFVQPSFGRISASRASGIIRSLGGR